MLYHEYYTWQGIVNDSVITHSDGFCSLAFSWQGVDHAFYNDSDHQHLLNQRLDLLKELTKHDGLTVENHWFRLSDTSVIDEYLEHGKKAIRGLELSDRIRQEIADHYYDSAKSNKVITVLTLSPSQIKSTLLGSIFKSKTQKKVTNWESLVNQLLSIFDEIQHEFKGAELLKSTIFEKIAQSYHQQYTQKFFYDNRYDLSEQVITLKPKIIEDHSCLKIGETFIKCLVVQNNPSLNTDWMLHLASVNSQAHIVQILKAKDTRKVVNKSREESDTDARTAGKKDTDFIAQGISDAGDYRKFIVENNLTVFDNTFIIVFHSKHVENIKENARAFVKFISTNGGLVRDDADLQMHLYRTSQIALGHHCQFSREDHSVSVACMMPFTVFESGVKNPESIRMTADYQIVGHAPSRLEVGHEITAAKTGGGKDTQSGTEVMETYPFGMDYYICEFGDSYRWVVEGFGGSYTTIDPDTTIINPMPPYSDAVNGKLPAQISLGTVEGLSIILLDESRELSSSEIAASENALNALYIKPKKDVQAPTLEDLLKSLKTYEFSNKQQQNSALMMYDNLFNFLDGSQGQAFKGQDNLQIAKGITGIDLMKIDRKLLKFYLTFIALRFAQNAFMNIETTSKIVLNELHVAFDVAPDVTTRLIKAVNRMGRKEGSHLGLITQGVKEITKIDDEIITSSPIRTLLARKDSWQELGKLLDMPSKAIEIWTNYNSNTEGLNYRQCMKSMNGRWYDLLLSFPKFALSVTSTTKSDRVLKHKIQHEHSSVFDRVEQLQKLKESK